MPGRGRPPVAPPWPSPRRSNADESSSTDVATTRRRAPASARSRPPARRSGRDDRPPAGRGRCGQRAGAARGGPAGATQWFYVELRSPRQGAPTLVSRMWVRADGKQMAGFRGPESTIDNQRVVVATMTSPFAPAGYPTLASLPTDPKVLLAVVRRTIRRNQAPDQLRNE